MSETNVNIAEAYYKAMRNKDLNGMEPYLHPQVQFLGPLVELRGKEAVLGGAGRLMSFFNTLTIRVKFGSDNQVMLAYDLDCPLPVGILRVAVLMTFDGSLISCIELFFDARSFDEKKDEIFGQ